MTARLEPIDRWSFSYDGDPKSAPRPRFVMGKGKRKPRTYNDPAYTALKAQIVAHMRMQPRPLWAGPDVPLVAVVRLVQPRTQDLRPRRLSDGTMSRPAEDRWATVHGQPVEALLGEIPAHSSAADVDNLAKTPLDAMTQAGVIDDDHLISGLWVSKHRAAMGERPRTDVTIYRWWQVGTLIEQLLEEL